MPPSPRLAAFLRPVGMIWASMRLCWEGFKDAVREHGLGAFARLPQIRDVALANMFSKTSKGFIAFEDTTVVPSLVEAASGVILELGPGPGNQIHRFSPSVTHIYGVEPNLSYKDVIEAKVKEHGLQNKYTFVAARLEDSDILEEAGITEDSLDTVLCIQVLCSVQNPKKVMKQVWKLLKPGGKFIFWEHGWSKHPLTMAEQALLNPAWSTFVGCHMTRDVLADILGGGEWENPGEIEAPEDPISVLPRIQGVLIKKA
ncbi:S-adenosyl-L-methionine-dependent methyltransferase [Xylaria venustula]|nr:S-adenosyl-L-methionine-dependent methyltransferase [Xylaria venustula]